MIKYSIWCLLLLSAGMVQSCQDEQTVKSKLLLARIRAIEIDINKTGISFDSYNQELSSLFVENGRKPLRKTQIDSARKLFLDYMKGMDKGIRNLGSLSEFDTTYKVVKANKAFFEHQKKFWNWLTPKILMVYGSGWENLSAEEKSRFTDLIKAAQTQQEITHALKDSVDSVAKQFRRKYNLKSD